MTASLVVLLGPAGTLQIADPIATDGSLRWGVEVVNIFLRTAATLLPATVLDGEVHALTVEGMQLSRELGAVTHRKRSLSNAAQRMIDTCLTTA